jgi:hypothetical protein
MLSLNSVKQPELTNLMAMFNEYFTEPKNRAVRNYSLWCRDIQQNGATTLSIATFSLITLSRRGLYVTLSVVTVSINATQHK